MPLYDMYCKKCGYNGEHRVNKHSDNVRCPDCGKSNLTKLISTFSIGGNSGEPEGFLVHSCGDDCALTAVLGDEELPKGTEVSTSYCPNGTINTFQCPSGKQFSIFTRNPPRRRGNLN